MGAAMESAWGPARRTTPMPPRPGGVAMATMVSSRFTALIVTGESSERRRTQANREFAAVLFWVYRGLGNKPRQKEARVLAVFCEGGAEFLCQHLFLNPGFCVEGKPSQRDRDHGAPFCDGQCSPNKRQQDPGIDRMAHVGVGAASNQFVLYLDGHVAAPILAQGVARPKGESNAEGSENKSDDRYWGALRKKSSPQHPPERGAREEQDPCCQQRDLIHNSRARGLLRLDCLQAQGRNQPIGEKNNPKRSQSITRQAIHNTNFLNFRSPVVLRHASD